MRLDFDDRGGWLVTPEELAQHLQMDVKRLRKQAALGLVSCSLEYGSGLDKGLSRVTVSVFELVWEAVFDSDGCLISEIRRQRVGKSDSVPQPETLRAG